MAIAGKFLLFFSSWFPAYIIVGFIASDTAPKVEKIAFLCTAISIVLYIFMERLIFSRSARSLKVKNITKRDENVLMYIIAYLPPFFSVDLSKNGQDYALIFFYIIFLFTYVKLDLYYLNPIFVFRSYKTYTLISEAGIEYIALIKAGHEPQEGDTVQYRGRDGILIINP